MSKKTYILLLFIIIGAICFSTYKYIYQDHRNVTQETPAFTLTAKAINEDFTNNTILAEKKYLNKTIVISGEITEINSNFITLENSIFCQFENSIPKSIKKNTPVFLKGRYIGFDDLLGEIKLDQCTILNDNF